ncbi:hypothetical protein GPECTOR_39g422 [Gonium pectorale]|uniref:Anaphase-promoting complex subunit 2 TPR repeats domain-containing protein n=1 Tax=Gonium pectorale TaxID=33097 RepID=A0A150GAT1_GONPE|nr:hypothetical protein GPECTOR_39g422 [Gonium pectorale]|eukprot:KXZ46928.1 hypothetical protein GPECTOR_39g422 [Gonium pectorale]
MQNLSMSLMASTSEVLVTAASTWMGYLVRLAAAAQQAAGNAGPAAAADAGASAAAGAVPLPTAAEVATLVSCGLGPALVSTVRQQLESLLEATAVPAFWGQMRRCRSAAAAGDDEALEQHLLSGLQALCSCVDSHCAALQQLADRVMAALAQEGAATAACTGPPAASVLGSAHSDQALALVPLLSRLTGQYRTSVSALLMATAEVSLSELLLLYYSSKLTQLAQTLAPLEQLMEAEEEEGAGGAGAGGGGATPPGGGGSGVLLAAMASGGGGGLGSLLGGGVGSGAVVYGAPPGYGARMSDGGVGSSAVEGVAMLMGSAQGGPDENTPPPSLRRASLQPSAVAAAMGPSWVRRLSGVCGCLASLALGPAGEEAVVAAVTAHVERLLRRLALGVYEREVLPAASRAAGRIPLEFLRLVIAGDGAASASASITPASASAPPQRGGCVAASTATTPPPSTAAGTDANPPSAATATGGGAAGGLAEPGTEARCLAEWRLRLSYLVFETLGRLRIGQMFDIVVEHPDSLPAVRDLAACLRHTNLQALFVSSFKRSLQQRLLHAGASATGIIHQYVATIRTMREIDPSDEDLRWGSGERTGEA